jgi:ribonucleoside-triphosphate reductase
LIYNIYLINQMDKTLCFNLEDIAQLKAKYRNPFNNELSAFTFVRTYSRFIFDQNGNKIKNESYFNVCLRCVNGIISIAKEKLIRDGKWSEREWQAKAKEMLEFMLQFKMLPPGRGLWAMGTPIIHTNRDNMALFNCTFVTTDNIDVVGAECFCYMMYALMVGAGCGYDARGAGKITIMLPEPANFTPNTGSRLANIITEIRHMALTSKKRTADGESYLELEADYITNISLSNRNHIYVHKIDDDRNGWVHAIRLLINSYIGKHYLVVFDYSGVRPIGTPLKTFGGTASGPRPLCEGIGIIRHLLHKNINKPISAVLIADIFNILAMIVIAGNVRRSSQIFVFDDLEMAEIKNWENPEYKYRTQAEGWAYNSNNSFILTDNLPNHEYRKILKERVVPGLLLNGEPGIFNIDLCRQYGRIADGPGNYDMQITGTNPCGEISLQGTSSTASDKPFGAGGELCCLAECVLSKVESEEEFHKILYYCTLYAKLVATLPIAWKGTEAIQTKNLRIGCSLTGIIEYLAKSDYDLDQFGPFLDRGYKRVKQCDMEISALFSLPLSKKTTTVKPSGTLSLIANTTSGMHGAEGQYYNRRVRISKNREDLLSVLRAHGIYLEDDIMNSTATTVASFPVKYTAPVRPKSEITLDFQFRLLKLLQEFWADNSVSCTIEFKEHEADQLADYLIKYRDYIKGVSFIKSGVSYMQQPQERITKEEYEEMKARIVPFSDTDFLIGHEEESDMYCDGDSCNRR